MHEFLACGVFTSWQDFLKQFASCLIIVLRGLMGVQKVLL